MEAKSYKGHEEWKLLINNLNWLDFQHLVYDLLNALGYTDIKERGGGSDGGRDLEATYIYPRPDGSKRTAKCWFQCKKQDKGVGFSEIHEDITRASTSKINEYYIVSNSDTTPPCKDEIEKARGTFHIDILDWSGLTFQTLLFGQPNICKYYFPYEEMPPIVNPKKPDEIINKSSDLLNYFGIRLQLNALANINLNNPVEVAGVLKIALLDLKGIDLSLKALIYQKVSMFFFSIKESDDALMFLDKSLEITPNNTQTLLIKGYILERINQLTESNACYDQILAIEALNKFALNNKAFNLWREGKFKDGLKLVEVALEVDPKFISAIANKMNILKGLKKTKEALEFLNEIDEIVKTSINLQSTKIDLLIELLDLREAFRLNEVIIKKDPNFIDGINNKGVILERNSQFQKREKYNKLAIECFEEAIKKDGKYALGWANKVISLINSNQTEEAEKIMNSVYNIFPIDPHILNNKGLLLINTDPKQAIKYFDKALNLLFTEQFVLNKAQAQLNARQYPETIETTDKLLEYNPEKSGAWGIKGQALRQLHQVSIANICFAKAEKFKEKPISLLEDE
jgi:tetratricopeptide (TPR) repeat protein